MRIALVAPRAVRRAATSALCAATLLLLVACGGGGDAATEPHVGEAGAPTAASERASAFQKSTDR